MSKRRWDQQGSDDGESSVGPSKSKTDHDDKPGGTETKSASEAAAAAAAIAAKIAAQFASGGFAVGGSGGGAAEEFTHDIDINDVRNRYLLTKGSTQEQIHAETGASVGTRGTWYPDRSKATAKDPPLYIHVSAKTQEVLQKAVDKINELISMDLGSLVEKGDKGRERRKWPEEKLPIGLESIRNFNVRAKVVGPSGSFVKYIQTETSTRVQIKGLGSGFIDQETGVEETVPMYIHITGPEEGQVARAKVLTDDLLLVVRQEHAKAQSVIQQQQMELHQAQAQYAAYSMGGYAPPPPSGAPPPPPGEGPPPAPPPPGTPAGDAAAQQAQQWGAQPPAPTDTEAYAAYWAAYGYDVNSSEFKEWQASQQQQYAQYYAAYTAQAGGGPAQPTEAPPPPPPPPS